MGSEMCIRDSSLILQLTRVCVVRTLYDAPGRFVACSDSDAVSTGVDGTMNDAGYAFCSKILAAYSLDYTSTGWFKHVAPNTHPVSNAVFLFI